MSMLSSNARKQQDEDVERLVKCRLRSEIEARKAVESTMKRAVHEARELKKELVLLRQEKEELRLAARKNAVSAPDRSDGKESARGSQKEATGASNDNQIGKQGSQKAVDLKLRQQIQNLMARNTEWETSTSELQQQLSDLESEKAAAVAQLIAELEDKTREIASLHDELKKTKLFVDETKRKCQKMLKEKREEAQRALQENEQLARCAKTLHGQLALLPQLKKQLEQAKEKRANMAEMWQKKLEQRDEAFLREEETSKQRLSENAAQIIELTDEKKHLQTRLQELERKLCDIDTRHEDDLRHEAQRRAELESTTKQLQEKLVAAEIATLEAEQAQVVAKETQDQETRLRKLAEDAADAVEVRADKAEHDLAQTRMQLNRLEEAHKARGVTLDYLLKQQTPGSVASLIDRNNEMTRTSSTIKKPPANLTSKTVPTAQRSRRTGSVRDLEYTPYVIRLQFSQPQLIPRC